MITGFNTDVKHKSRVFHIQTEDKGESNPFVESLVYVGGEILATKRTSYAEVIKEGRDDPAVQDLMEQQHRTMIAAVQRGRFDGPDGGIQIPEGMSAVGAPAARADKLDKADRVEKADKVEKIAKPLDKVAKAEPSGPEGVEAEENGEATAPPGTPSPLPAIDRSLDQLVLDYLVSGDMPDEVELTLTPKPDFLSGRSVQTRLKATSGSPARPLAGAAVHVRILSTSARASTVFHGRTATDGSCMVSFMVPADPGGTAAAVIRVTAPSASSEIQYPIRKK